MSWNYRIFKTENKVDGGFFFDIREAYYADGKVDAYSSVQSAPYCHSKDGLKIILENMLHAFDKPVINITGEENDI